jgi:hypothetical protein
MTDAAARIAGQLRRRGLGAPARLLVDAHRPLAPLLTDLGTAIAPLLEIAGGPVRDVGDVLRAPNGLDRLIGHLDAADEGDDGGAG